MSQELVLGIILLLIGGLFCLWGNRIAQAAIAFWGFLIGFPIGAGFANLVADGAVAAWVAGLIAGLLFSWLFVTFFKWAIILSGGLIGYGIGRNLAAFFGFDSSGALFTGGLIVAAILVLMFVVFNAKKIYLAIITSVFGASVALTGLLVLIGKIPAEGINSLTDHTGSLPSFWALVYVIGVIAAVVFQLSSNGRAGNTDES